MIAFSRSDSERDRWCNRHGLRLGSDRTGSFVRARFRRMSLTNEPGICAGLIASQVQVLSNAPSREEPSWSVGSDSDIGMLSPASPVRGGRPKTSADTTPWLLGASHRDLSLKSDWWGRPSGTGASLRPLGARAMFYWAPVTASHFPSL